MLIAIVEDNKQMQTELAEKLHQWESLHHFSLDLCVFNSGSEFLESIDTKRYQLVFMDIYLDNESGIDTALQYRQSDIHSILVFLTSSENHMKQAFACRAFDYLLKPVTEQALFHMLDEVMRTLAPGDHTLSVLVGDITYPVHFSDIRFVTAQRNYCLVQTSEALMPRTAFGLLSEKLSKDARFCLINRGILVNLDWVEKFTNRECVMTTGDRFPLHTKRHTQLMQQLIDYRFKKREAHMRRIWYD